MKVTGPDFEVEQGAVKEFTLTAADTPPVGAAAILRIGRQVSADPRFQSERVANSRLEYVTVSQDDCEIDADDILVSIDTATLAGVQYLWQVDLVTDEAVLIERWRGIMLVSASLPPL